MPQTPNRFYDQLSRLWTDATGVAHGVRREAGTLFRSQAERFIADMDLVKREDFDAVREVAATARAENERLHARVAALEERLAALTGTPVPAAPAGVPAGPRRRTPSAAVSVAAAPAAMAPAPVVVTPDSVEAAKARSRTRAKPAANDMPETPTDGKPEA